MQNTSICSIQKSQYSESFSKLMENAMKAAQKPSKTPIILSRTKKISSLIYPSSLRIYQMQNSITEFPKLKNRHRQDYIHQQQDLNYFSSSIMLQKAQQNNSNKKYSEKRCSYRIRTQSQNKNHYFDIYESLQISSVKGQRKNVRVNLQNKQKNYTTHTTKKNMNQKYKSQWSLQPWDWNL